MNKLFFTVLPFTLLVSCSAEEVRSVYIGAWVVLIGTALLVTWMIYQVIKNAKHANGSTIAAVFQKIVALLPIGLVAWFVIFTIDTCSAPGQDQSNQGGQPPSGVSEQTQKDTPELVRVFFNNLAKGMDYKGADEEVPFSYYKDIPVSETDFRYAELGWVKKDVIEITISEDTAMPSSWYINGHTIRFEIGTEGAESFIPGVLTQKKQGVYFMFGEFIDSHIAGIEYFYAFEN